AATPQSFGCPSLAPVLTPLHCQMDRGSYQTNATACFLTQSIKYLHQWQHLCQHRVHVAGRMQHRTCMVTNYANNFDSAAATPQSFGHCNARRSRPCYTTSLPDGAWILPNQCNCLL